MNLGKKKLSKSKLNCSLLVSSCDSYEDLWEPFLNTFKKNWPDCDIEKYFITENKKFIKNDFTTIKCGLKKNWTDRLYYSLSSIEDDYVILMLEDFFLRSKINNEDIHYFIKYIQKYDLSMIRLIKRPQGTCLNTKHPKLTQIHKDDLFRVSTQATIWNKKILKNLLKKNENIWEFELNGSVRSKSLMNFFCVKNNVMTYRHHVVERGKWFPWYAFYYSFVNKVGIDLKTRSVMGLFETFKWILNKFFAAFFSKLPAFVSKPIKYIAKKTKIYES